LLHQSRKFFFLKIIFKKPILTKNPSLQILQSLTEPVIVGGEGAFVRAKTMRFYSENSTIDTPAAVCTISFAV